jgi:hypothetical protein
MWGLMAKRWGKDDWFDKGTLPVLKRKRVRLRLCTHGEAVATIVETKYPTECGQ